MSNNANEPHSASTARKLMASTHKSGSPSFFDTAPYKTYIENWKQRKEDEAMADATKFQKFSHIRQRSVQSRRPHHLLDKQLEYHYSRILVLSMLGLVLYIILSILTWNFSTADPREMSGPWLLVYYILKLGIVLTSLMAVVAILISYVHQAFWYIVEGEYWSLTQMLFKSKLTVRCVVEVVVHLVVPIPFLETTWGFGDKIGIFMFIRAYLIARRIADVSALTTRRHIIQILLRNTDVNLSWGVSLLIWVKDHLTAFFFVSTLVAMNLAAFCLWIIERDEEDTLFADLSSNFYFMVVTGTTIGYGDISPNKTWGRVIAMILGCWMIFVVVLFGSLFISILEPSRVHKYAVAYVTLQEHRTAKMQAAASLIQAAWRYSRDLIFLPDYVYLSNKHSKRFHESQASITRYRSILREHVEESTNGLEAELDKIIAREQRSSNLLGVVQVIHQEKRSGLRRSKSTGTVKADFRGTDHVISRAVSMRTMGKGPNDVDSNSTGSAKRTKKDKLKVKSTPASSCRHSSNSAPTTAEAVVVEDKVIQELKQSVVLLKNRLSKTNKEKENNLNQLSRTVGSNSSGRNNSCGSDNLDVTDEVKVAVSLLKQQADENTTNLSLLSKSLHNVETKLSKVVHVINALNDNIPLSTFVQNFASN